ncbi:helix-hairpin-helix domain-containing protein [Parabacteroides faecis]|uniref:helix-hairpin-helix domain-containing protein n=1 Tax=Parabacteroides faecis TaxID=1217282 RepID=UPI002164CAE8|nr:helix-hairpin-helix domain-containing protein [Parabacteroides faecis]MCS2890640.1 helix-hairpin-helix domain-containing protein [Parabacteroides faecis]UVQ45691.1 helix-hairpin-helix domain-containing protein [Parabacteroides faecis]
MKRLWITLLVYLLINSYNLNSQNIYSVDKWMEYMEELASETEDEARIENLYTDLSYLAEHPFELNSVTENELKRLPFLSDQQITSLLTYRTKYGKLVTLYELKNMEGMDFDTISLLLPFVYIGDISVNKRPFSVKNLLKYGSNELQIRYDKCFQQKKGYCSYPDSILQQYPNRKYLGEPFYHHLRYSYAFDDRLQLGIVAEKDAGEPFWNSYHKGYDFYSVHLFFKDMNKWLKSLAIGDYKVSFGQGLVISNDFTPGRSSIVAQAERRTNGFRRHFSTNENDYFRGMASTVALKQFYISLFYSYRKLDAGVDNNEVSSFKTDGLHRLERDWEKKHTVPMQTYGGNVRYEDSNFSVGITALSYSFGKYRIQPDPKPYNLFYFRGNDNINMSVDYMLKTKKVKFYGETAVSFNKAVATLNAFQLTPVSYLSLLVLHRYYDRRYQAFFGNAFGQNSSVQNEQGVYAGMQWTPFAHFKLSMYADVFRFPWLKYGVDAPSSGQEYMVQLDADPGKNFAWYLRYKYRKKEKNRTLENESTLNILPYSQQRFRLQFLYGIRSVWILKTSADCVYYDEWKGKRSLGWMISQGMGWKPSNLPFQSDIYMAYFHTDDYYSRINSYEKNILYAFNMPSFYGRGIRLSFSFRWNILDKLSLSAKLGHTYYADRNVIGTDQEEIEGHNKTDLYALLRYKF